MFIRWGWILGAFLIACATIPMPPRDLSTLDCQARLDCYVVRVDNGSGQNQVEFRINGIKYGDVSAYGYADYSLFTSRMIHGNCAYVTAKPIANVYGRLLRSEEVCIYQGQYFLVSITNNQGFIWLTPYSVGSR